MSASYQLTVDCASPAVMSAFWAQALHYVPSPAPPGHATWDDFYRSVGVPEEELDGSADRIEDPDGHGPRLWFQVVPETKTIKNRLHLDLDVGGGRGTPWPTRRDRVEAEAGRLVGLGATRVRTAADEAHDHYAVAMTDPEGNEFDVM